MTIGNLLSGVTSAVTVGDGISGATAGSVLFIGAGGTLSQDNGQLFWDDTNNRLGIGTTAPAAQLHVSGSGPVEARIESNNNNAVVRFIRSGSQVGFAGGVSAGEIALSGDGSLAKAVAVNAATGYACFGATTVGIGAKVLIAAGTHTTDINALGVTQTWNAAGVTFAGIKANFTDTASAAGSLLLDLQLGGASQVKAAKAGGLTACAGTAIPAGGTAGSGVMVSSTANFGVFFGSGAPTLSAAKGSLYLRSDGTGVLNRAYINTDSGTTWTALTTAA